MLNTHLLNSDSEDEDGSQNLCYQGQKWSQAEADDIMIPVKTADESPACRASSANGLPEEHVA